MEHKKVVQQWYEINFSSSHRFLGGKIDAFLDESPELDEDEDLANEKWSDNHTILRDYEGDFDGVLIYHNSTTEPLIRFICGKIEIDYEEVKNIDFKLVG